MNDTFEWERLLGYFELIIWMDNFSFDFFDLVFVWNGKEVEFFSYENYRKNIWNSGRSTNSQYEEIQTHSSYIKKIRKEIVKKINSSRHKIILWADEFKFKFTMCSQVNFWENQTKSVWP